MTDAPSRWLFSRRLDLALFGGSAALAVGLLGVGKALGILDGDAPLWVWALTVVGVDVAHVWATGWRVYADGPTFRARPALYVAVPAAAYATGVVAHALSPALFWRLLAYAAAFHFVRQQYGWVALYRRKNGETDGRLLDSLTIYGATLAPLVHWHANLPRRFHWLIAGDFASGLPRAAGTLAIAAFGAIAALYAAKEVVRARRGLAVSWGKNLVMATTALTWFLGIVVWNSDYAFTVTNVLVHGIPYFGLVWVSARARRAERVARGDAPTLADRAALSPLLFLLPLVAAAFLEEWGWDRLVWHDYGVLFPGAPVTPGPALLSLLVPLLSLPQSTHYLLDGFIWRMRAENRDVAEALGLKAAA